MVGIGRVCYLYIYLLNFKCYCESYFEYMLIGEIINLFYFMG